MKLDTQQLLDELYSETEQQLRLAIAEWQRMPAVRLLTQPAPGQWSAAQCLEHLNSYGRYYLPGMEKAIAGQPTHFSRTFKPGMFGNYFYKIMLPATGGRKLKKMSSPKEHVPAVELDPSKTVADFIDQSERLLAIIDRARSVDLNTIKIPISISRFIRLKLGDTLRFVIAHNLRHVQQAVRALEAPTQFLAKQEKGTAFS